MKTLFVLMHDYDGNGVFGDEFSDYDVEVVRQERADMMDGLDQSRKRFKIQARSYLEPGEHSS